MLKLDEDNKVTFVFNETPGGANADDPTTIVDAPAVGDCPICKGEVRETPNSIVCIKNPIVSKGKCKFRVTKTLLDLQIPPEELRALLNDGKTSLLKGFKSRKTRRLFDATLFLKEDGGIGFEFPSRPKRAASA
jgi:DNA topoisomerase-3